MTTYYAATSTLSPYYVIQVNQTEGSIPSDPPPFVHIHYVAITESEYNQVQALGLTWPGFPSSYRWVWVTDHIEESPDPRPEFTFTPTSVSLEVGDSPVNVSVEADDEGLNGNVDIGNGATLAFTDGAATLSVTTVVPKSFLFEGGTYYRAAAPLSISVAQPAGQI